MFNSHHYKKTIHKLFSHAFIENHSKKMHFIDNNKPNPSVLVENFLLDNKTSRKYCMNQTAHEIT